MHHQKLEGVVEHVFSGQRLKIYVPKQNVMLSFSVAGVKCPAPSRDGKPAEPCADEAFQVTNRLLV